MATNQSDSQAPIFLERLQGLFSKKDRGAGADEDEPQRRGVVIAACLLLSFLLWFVFTLQEVYTTEVEMPTTVTNLPAGEALTELPPPSVRVRVQGEGLQLLRIALNPPEIPIDASAGEVNIEGMLNLPPGVQPQSVIPRRLQLDKEERIRRRIPIALRADIQTPPTHDLSEEPNIDPDSVVVSGARSIIENLQAWPTDTLRLREVRDSIVTHVPLADTLQGLVTRNVREVRARIRAERFTEGNREIEVRVPGTPERAVTLEPSVVRVRYRVPVDQYQQAQQADDFFAEVAYDEVRADTTGYVRPTLNLPVDLDIRDVEMIPPRLRYYSFISGE